MAAVVGWEPCGAKGGPVPHLCVFVCNSGTCKGVLPVS